MYAPGAQHLANASFPGTSGRPCRSQIHKIQTGNNNDKYCQQRKNGQVFGVAQVFHIPVKTGGMEMNIRKGLKCEAVRVFRNIFFDQFCYPGFQGFPVGVKWY